MSCYLVSSLLLIEMMLCLMFPPFNNRLVPLRNTKKLMIEKTVDVCFFLPKRRNSMFWGHRVMTHHVMFTLLFFGYCDIWFKRVMMMMMSQFLQNNFEAIKKPSKV